MAETIGDAFVAVHADTTGFVSGMKGAAGAVAGIFGAIKVGQFLGDSLAQAKEAQKVGAQTAAVLKSTGGAANITAGQINDLANALSKKVGIDDEVIQAGENMLLTFRAVRNEAGKGNDIFNQATKTSLDLSVALGRDLTGTTIMLGKALQDPIAGLTALRRVGVGFTESQKEMIKTLVASGDTLGAQKVILREVTKEFGGSAAAQVTSADKAKVAIQNLKESIGVALMPAVKVAAQAITALADGFNSLPAPMRSLVTYATLIGGSLLAAAIVAEKFGGAFSIIKSGAEAAVGAIKIAIGTIRTLGASTLLATGGIALAFAALIAGIVYIATAADKLGPGFATAEAAGKRLGQTTLSFARASGDEVGTLEKKIKDLDLGIKVLQADLDRRTGGSVELQAESAAATSDALSLKQLHTERDILNKRLAEAKAAHAQETAAIEASKQGIDGYITALRGGVSATEALTRAGKAGEDAITGFQNALAAAAGGALGYQAAQQNITKAQEDLNLALYLFGPGSKEATAAQLTLNQAQLAGVTAAQSADQAQQALIESLFKGNTTYKAQIGLLYEQLQLHPENAAGIQLEVDKLNAAKAAADAIPGSKSVTVTADVSQALGAFGQLEQAAGRVGQIIRETIKPIDIFGGGRQSGGPVRAGGTYLVGEKGPELLTLGASGGYVTPNARTGGLTVQGDLVVADTSVLADLDYWAVSRAAAGGI